MKTDKLAPLVILAEPYMGFAGKYVFNSDNLEAFREACIKDFVNSLEHIATPPLYNLTERI